MSAAAEFGYLHARVSVLAERLLPQQRLYDLILAGPDEEAALLAAAGLGGLEREVLNNSPVLDQVLISGLIQDAEVLSHALTGTARDLLIYWIRRIELRNLKAIIRGKMSGMPNDEVRQRLLDIGQFSTLPVEDLLGTEDPAELLRRLEVTPYADIARQARRVYEEHQQLFALDAAVDRRYFSGLTKRAKSVGPGGGEQLRALIGSVIDRLNLSWLLRYRFAYQLSPAESYYLLIPAGFHISSAQFRELAQLNSVAEVLDQIPAPLHGVVEGLTTITAIDRALERETWRVATLTLQRTAFNLARAFAYLILRERDINLIYAVLLGKRLHLDPALIRESIGAPTTTVTAAA